MNTCTKAQLKEILKNHKLWLESNRQEGEPADFLEEILRRVNFSGKDLREANFCGANLWGANFQGANLLGADFERANLDEANLQGANLREVNFQNTNLIGTTGLVVPEVGKAYEIIREGYYFQVNNRRRWMSFEENEICGLILGIHGTQNENHLEFDKGKGSFDLLFLDGDKKGQVWKGIDWWVLLTCFGKEIK